MNLGEPNFVAYGKQIIVQFKKCHDDHPVTKFFGVCTDLKVQLDKCFRAEVRDLTALLLALLVP